MTETLTNRQINIMQTLVSMLESKEPIKITTAYMSWDLQRMSDGRFELGLGSQVKGHNERRFGVQWSAPAPRIKEYVESIRAIWDCWQNGSQLN